MADEDAPPVLEIKVNENTYRLDFDELSGRDAQEFAGHTGASLAGSIMNMAEGNGVGDLHIIAGLVWLARRKLDRSLRYETVNMGLNYGMLRRGEVKVSAEGDDEEAPPDPPA